MAPQPLDEEGRLILTQKNTLDRAAHYALTALRDEQPPPSLPDVLHRMITSGIAVPGQDWVVGPHGIESAARGNAYFRVMQDPRHATPQDVNLIFFQPPPPDGKQ